jgi:hypothetical protein
MMFFIPILFLLSACSILDYPSRVLGISVEKFENEKVGRFSKAFNMSKEICFNKSINIVKELNARITHKNFKKGYIVVFDLSKSFDYCLDSTEVAIFVTDMKSKGVKVDVISNNSFLAAKFADRFFKMLK